MKRTLPIILIVIGLASALFGYSKLDESRATLSMGEMHLSATDEGGRTQSYVLLGLGAVCIVAGVGMMVRSRS